MDVVIIGCGFTGARVAERLLAGGTRVFATTRNLGNLAALQGRGVNAIQWDASDPRRLEIPEGSLVLHSVPTLHRGNSLSDPTPALLASLGARPSRIVYLSTTGVYGEAREVDHRTPVNARSDRERLRLDAERSAAAGPWSSLVLRPAAIYGPGRGIHVSMERGQYSLVGDGGNFVSRIHVDDLAAHAEAALRSEITGAFPVADEEPCTAREIALFCAKLLNVPMPDSVPVDSVHDTRRADRRVDGRAIRELLGIRLKYPSYRTGIPASLVV